MRFSTNRPVFIYIEFWQSVEVGAEAHLKALVDAGGSGWECLMPAQVDAAGPTVWRKARMDTFVNSANLYRSPSSRNAEWWLPDRCTLRKRFEATSSGAFHELPGNAHSTQGTYIAFAHLAD